MQITSSKQTTLSLSTASLGDVLAINNLINKFAAKNLLLKRSIEDIRSDIDTFIIVRENPVVKTKTTTTIAQSRTPIVINDLHPARNKGVIIGCVSLYRYSSVLAEIRSLCVEEAYQGLGIARRLLEEAIVLARRLDIKQLLSFTVEAEQFFIKLGFTHVTKERLPGKVMKDCQKCPCYGNCSAKSYRLSL
ncbi:amino-acid acetyltransferase [Spirochaetota bacterium]|nr:amino-acid acetyltransferase [Spirochaetota bacterium]